VLSSLDPNLQIPYKLVLHLHGVSNDFSYTIHLTEQEENNPLPRLKQEVNQIHAVFQQQGLPHLSITALHKILEDWAGEIMVGYREVHLRREMAPIEQDDLEYIQDTGCSTPQLLAPSLEGLVPHLVLLPPLGF